MRHLNVIPDNLCCYALNQQIVAVNSKQFYLNKWKKRRIKTTNLFASGKQKTAYLYSSIQTNKLSWNMYAYINLSIWFNTISDNVCPSIQYLSSSFVTDTRNVKCKRRNQLQNDTKPGRTDFRIDIQYNNKKKLICDENERNWKEEGSFLIGKCLIFAAVVDKIRYTPTTNY